MISPVSPALYMQRVNQEIIKAAAYRRQRHGAEAGARAPGGLGAAPVTLAVVQGQRGRITPLGYKTARRALPPILAALPATDPRRRAADALASAYEQVGAIKGADWLGGDTSGGASDGGVTTKIKHAARLRVVQAAINGWGRDPVHGGIRPGPDRVVLAVQRQRGLRQDIKAFALLVGLCVEGQDLATILRAHGWSTGTKHSRPLGQAALALLADTAVALGLGRCAKNPGS